MSSNLIEKYFKFKEHNTNLRTEIIAGITTFLTMAYIIMVNPAILSSTGMNYGAVFVATCLVAILGSLCMGVLANYPIALAPSMTLNTYFAYMVVQVLNYPWQLALGAVLIAGVLFFLLTLVGNRQKIIYTIPDSLKIALSAGIGLFLGVIGLKNLNIVSILPIPSIHLNVLLEPTVWLAFGGLTLIVILDYYRVLGAILIGIIAISGIGIILGFNHFQGVISIPPSIAPTLFKFHVTQFSSTKTLTIIFTFFFVALFDSTGTLIAILRQAGLILPNGTIERLTQALLADSTATIIGSLLGTSSTGSYIESSAGVRAGGRTGFTAVTVAFLFLLALFFAPLAKAIPNYATAPALLYIAILMSKNLSLIKWRDYSESLPAIITTLAIPLTFSIAKGISLGVISYVILHLLTRKFYKLNSTLWVLAVIFACYLGLLL